MADDREPYGRIVRETWVGWAKEQDEPKASWLLSWEDLDDGQRKVDKRIGSAVAARADADAKLDADRMRVRLFALGAHMPAILDALRVAAADTEFGARAKRFGAALEALGGGEEGDGHG